MNSLVIIKNIGHFQGLDLREALPVLLQGCHGVSASAPTGNESYDEGQAEGFLEARPDTAVSPLLKFC